MNESTTNSAVLLLVFNRPKHTEKVFDVFRAVRPPRLYVSADGPRPNVESDQDLCRQVRQIVTRVDWPCELHTLFRDENAGCKQGVSTGIDWFFEHEEQGIILEDDCVPSEDFFGFADCLLERYARDPRVWVITGDNFQAGIKRGDAAYYFSRYNHCWGWATWRRAWEHYDGALTFWPRWRDSSDWREHLPDPVAQRYWTEIFDKVYQGHFDSWAYPWLACVWFHGGLTATPNVNLVQNIGFGPEAHHTKRARPDKSPRAGSLSTITHPDAVEVDDTADRFTFDHHFNGRNQRWPRKFLVRGARAALAFATYLRPAKS